MLFAFLIPVLACDGKKEPLPYSPQEIIERQKEMDTIYLARLGDPAAMARFGLWRLRGAPVAADEDDGCRWSLKAALKGDVGAQFTTGRCYDKGWKETPPDPAEAMRWYLAAANGGNLQAAFEVATHYQQGRGVVVDAAEAFRWYSRLAEQGHAGAQYLLGMMYANGEGTPVNRAEALRLLRLAAATGHAQAIEAVARFE
ncbi:MAG: sel1 repeat family protein [Nitrospinae bacterium]|nr:sel1 repeat family protein [Nitrospinota bacterium]